MEGDDNMGNGVWDCAPREEKARAPLVSLKVPIKKKNEIPKVSLTKQG